MQSPVEGGNWCVLPLLPHPGTLQNKTDAQVSVSSVEQINILLKGIDNGDPSAKSEKIQSPIRMRIFV